MAFSSIETIMEGRGSKPENGFIGDWNRTQVQDLIEFQRKFKTGCFFIGIYMAAAARCRKLLPHASDFLRDMLTQHKDLLEPNTLSPSHRHFNQALNIYHDFGLQVSRLTVNKEAEKILADNGVSLQSLTVPTQLIPSWKPFTLELKNQPFGAWVHQLGCNDSHYITADGSVESQRLIEDYETDLYRPIALMEFDILGK